jgi:hypothetical protein
MQGTIGTFLALRAPDRGEAAIGEGLRILPRKDWKWGSEEDRFYVVILGVEIKILDDGRLVLNRIDLFQIGPVLDLNDLCRLCSYKSLEISDQCRLRTILDAVPLPFEAFTLM